jgi:hypothetical protein
VEGCSYCRHEQGESTGEAYRLLYAMGCGGATQAATTETQIAGQEPTSPISKSNYRSKLWQPSNKPPRVTLLPVFLRARLLSRP